MTMTMPMMKMVTMTVKETMIIVVYRMALYYLACSCYVVA